MTKTPTKTTDPDTLATRLEHLASFEDRLWQDCPAVRTARARVDRLPEALAAVRDALTLSGDVGALCSAAISRALDGEPLDADRLRTDMVAAAVSTQTREALSGAFAKADVDTRLERATAERAHADAALTVLHDTVQDLVDIGRALIPQTALTGSLADSARAGQARALLEEAVHVHDRLRARQFSLTISNTVHGPVLARQFGIVHDVSTLAPWAEQLVAPGQSWAGAPDLEALVDAAGEPLFRLVCRDDLQAWVPNETQFLAARAALKERTDKARYRLQNNRPAASTQDAATFTLTTTDQTANRAIGRVDAVRR